MLQFNGIQVYFKLLCNFQTYWTIFQKLLKLSLIILTICNVRPKVRFCFHFRRILAQTLSFDKKSAEHSVHNETRDETGSIFYTSFVAAGCSLSISLPAIRWLSHQIAWPFPSNLSNIRSFRNPVIVQFCFSVFCSLLSPS